MCCNHKCYKYEAFSKINGYFSLGINDVEIPHCNTEHDDCICGKCDDTCKTCAGHKDNDCLSCKGNDYLTKKGTCVTECPEKTYGDVCPKTKFNRCYDCHESCAKCSAGGPKDCTVCTKGYTMIDQICYEKERVQDYIRNNIDWVDSDSLLSQKWIKFMIFILTYISTFKYHI